MVKIGTSGGEVPSSTKIFVGTADITSKYSVDTSTPGSVKFTPKIGQVVYDAVVLSATVADAVGNVSTAATSAPYTFANSIDINAAKVAGANGNFSVSAAGADYLFTVDAGSSYTATVTGFGAGDKVVFRDVGVPSVTIPNISYTDGLVVASALSGDNLVNLTLSSLDPSTSDGQIFGLASFNSVFGANSISATSNVSTAPSLAVPITGAGTSDAAGANVAYTISGGEYAATISNFRVGDTINFKANGAAPEVQILNLSTSDGSVLITGVFAEGNVGLTLTNLALADDALIFGTPSFNSVFGPGSLVKSGQALSQSVDVSSANNGGAAGFDASTGPFLFNIGEGTYSSTINGFGPGDSISFFGSKEASLNVPNINYADGVVLIQGAVDGQQVDVTLRGLSVVTDGQIFGPLSFNNTFGQGSLIA